MRAMVRVIFQNLVNQKSVQLLHIHTCYTFKKTTFVYRNAIISIRGASKYNQFLPSAPESVTLYFCLDSGDQGAACR